MPSVGDSTTWEVTNDPSGDFIGGVFTAKDLRYTAQMCNWPDGISWRNRVTHAVAIYTNHMLQFSPPNERKVHA